MHILLIVEQADPNGPYQGRVGYYIAKALNAVLELHIVTREENVEALLSAGLREEQITGIHSKQICKGVDEEEPAGQYRLFERAVWKQLKAKLKAKEFDLVHRLTPMSVELKSKLARRLKRLGIPYVIGPIKQNVAILDDYGSLPEHDLIRKKYLKVQAYQKRVSVLIYASEYYLPKAIKESSKFRISVVNPNGYNPEQFPVSQVHFNDASKRAVRIAFVAPLVPYGGADILIEAVVALAKKNHVILDIIGDGPQMESLMKLAGVFDIKNLVKFPGKLSEEKTIERLSRAAIFACPSVRAFDYLKLTQAMALGLAPIVAEYDMLSECLPGDAGCTVPVYSRESLITGFHWAINRYIEKPRLLYRTRKAVQRHAARNLSWQSIAQEISGCYEDAFRVP